MIERGEAVDAFATLQAFLKDGSGSVLNAEEIAKLGAAIKVVNEWSSALKRCLDGAQCPAKVTMKESPSGVMVDEDTPGPSYLEFWAEHQAP